MMLRSFLFKQRQVLRCDLQRGLFGRKKKEVEKDKKTDDPTDLEVKRQYELDNASLFSTKYNMNLIKHKGKLTNQKAYKPPQGVVDAVREVVEQFNKGQDWMQADFKDVKLKFNVLSALTSQLKKDIPSYHLDSLVSTQQIINFFQTEVTLTSSYDDLAAGTIGELPRNLHIQKEPLRFHPADDTLFNGKTAFPGSNTVVTSIKYQRKYQGCVTTKEKPGFNNYYYDY